MEKEQNQNIENNTSKKREVDEVVSDENTEISKNETETIDEDKTKNIETKLLELEDKLARTFAEMENQRRRFEKEKEEAFEYGGFSFAKEALNLIDNLERSKQILQNDESLKNSDALKKTLEHLNIINKNVNYYFLCLGSQDTVNFFLPLALLLARTFLPFTEAILSLKPCLFLLFLFDG